MKNYDFIIALFLILIFNLSGTNISTQAQDKKDTVKKSTYIDEWNTDKKEIKDKVVGKTKDGKIIYEGPRGGRYYISAKGHKTYIKKK